METVVEKGEQKLEERTREDQTLLLFASLMEGGREDDETCRDLDRITSLLNEDAEASKKDPFGSICKLIDGDCVDTILCYLDMRQDDVVRGHATLTTSAYLKAAGEEGSKLLKDFFNDRVARGTYDDYIVAFCVASVIFPIVPDVTAELFLSEGFLPSLGPLMRRKWKSRKVETACLEMLNAACMHPQCREGVQKYCTEWLEEIVDQDPEEVVQDDFFAADPDINARHGSISMKRHSEQVQHLAAVILAKLRAIQPIPQPGEGEGRVTQATTSIEDLSRMFTNLLVSGPEHATSSSVEGLAYASLQPTVREQLSSNMDLLLSLVKTLDEAPPKSPLTYGALSIFVNLTRFQPTQSEEEKRMNQLKAYANAAGKINPEPLIDNEHVTERCKRVFAAGVVPVLVTHSKHSSPASLSIIISIINSLATVTSLRGQLAQQGAVRLLVTAYNTLHTEDRHARRTAAQALARILISTNPEHVFGGNRANTIGAAIHPLVSIINPEQSSETRDLLPTFESLMALTNLASTGDETCRGIISAAWTDIEEQLLSSNHMVTRAATELICNLVQSPTALSLYIGSPRARDRLHVLVALADAEDEGTRSGAGGALAMLTGAEEVVRSITNRERGVEIILGLCADDKEDIRHRGAVVVFNMAVTEGETGRLAREKIRALNGIEILTECAKKSRRTDVLDVTVQAIKLLLEEN